VNIKLEIEIVKRHIFPGKKFHTKADAFGIQI
jgi:hypothetical protein